MLYSLLPVIDLLSEPGPANADNVTLLAALTHWQTWNLDQPPCDGTDIPGVDRRLADDFRCLLDLKGEYRLIWIEKAISAEALAGLPVEERQPYAAVLFKWWFDLLTAKIGVSAARSRPTNPCAA